MGARQILAGHMTVGQLFSYTMFLGFLIAPVAQMASIVLVFEEDQKHRSTVPSRIATYTVSH
jgi:ABC-type bacteriocin/lantibiotic exporter with double-glycine peptidase domain